MVALRVADPERLQHRDLLGLLDSLGDHVDPDLRRERHERRRQRPRDRALVEPLCQRHVELDPVGETASTWLRLAWPAPKSSIATLPPAARSGASRRSKSVPVEPAVLGDLGNHAVRVLAERVEEAGRRDRLGRDVHAQRGVGRQLRQRADRRPHRQQLQRDPEVDVPGVGEPAVRRVRRPAGEARERLVGDRAAVGERDDRLEGGHVASACSVAAIRATQAS